MRKSLAPLAIAAGAISLSACDALTAPASDSPIWAREETIEALGRAYVEFPPDRASFTVFYEEVDPDQTRASFIASRRLNLATEAIREIAGDSVRLTSDMDVSPYYEQVRIQVAEHREQLRENVHPDSLLGYRARGRLDVVVEDFESLELVRGAAMAAGPTSIENIEFWLDETAEVQRQAFAAAVEDAAARARIVADASGQSLGGLLLLREGSATCLGEAYGDPGRASEDQIVVTGSRIQRRDFEATSPISIDPEMLAEIGNASEITARTIIDNAAFFTLAADYGPQTLEARVCAIFTVD